MLRHIVHLVEWPMLRNIVHLVGWTVKVMVKTSVKISTTLIDTIPSLISFRCRYFFTMSFFDFFMFERLRLLRILAFFNSKHFPEFMRSYLHRYSAAAVDEIHNTKIVFFAKDASLQNKHSPQLPSTLNPTKRVPGLRSFIFSRTRPLRCWRRLLTISTSLTSVFPRFTLISFSLKGCFAPRLCTSLLSTSSSKYQYAHGLPFRVFLLPH
jgi:hypothetical protein